VTEPGSAEQRARHTRAGFIKVRDQQSELAILLQCEWQLVEVAVTVEGYNVAFAGTRDRARNPGNFSLQDGSP
jgi:hypothetical protein